MAKPRNVKRQLNNKILIVCGGETEEIYFKKFNCDLAEVSIDAKLKRQSPTQIVNHAIKLKSTQKYRMVWCIFDKDNFTDFDTAIKLAEDNSIKYAFSNQAFELWFILHYERKECALNRTKYENIIEKNIKKTYSKTDLNMYDLLKSRMDIAVNNAKIGHQLHKANGGKPSQWESCTNVYELVKELLRWKK